jgi:hypothetical protein
MVWHGVSDQARGCHHVIYVFQQVSRQPVVDTDAAFKETDVGNVQFFAVTQGT